MLWRPLPRLALKYRLVFVTDRFAATDWPSLSPSIREQPRNISDFDRVGACFISHNQAQLDDQIITRLKARGVPILCWTVQSQADAVKAQTMADNITFGGYLA